MTHPTGHNVTASAMKQLAACPEAYFKANVAKDPRRYDKGTAANIGILLHDAIHEATVSGLAEITGADLLSFLERPLKTDADAQLVGARLDVAALAQARELAKPISREIDVRGVARPDGKPLAEEPLTFDAGGVVVGGIWDRVDAPTIEIITVIDYKTGADILDRDEMRLDPQALTYAAAARARWPQARVSVEFHRLTRGVVVTLPWTPEIDALARQMARDHVAAVAWHTKRGKWPAKPSRRACGECPFRANCTAYLHALETKALPDPTRDEDLAGMVTGFHEASEAEGLAGKRKRDLAESLRAVIAERGEFPMAGRKVRMGKRNTPKWNDWKHTLTRASELTGIAFAELERDCLTISSKKLDEKIDALDVSKANKRAIKEGIDDTGTLDVATWVETRALPDPFAAALEETDESGVPESPARSVTATEAASLGGVAAATSPQLAASPIQTDAAAGSFPPTIPPFPDPAAAPPSTLRPDGFCSSCGAPVTWGKTINGRKCPFNADGTSHFTNCPNAAKHKKPRAPKPHAAACSSLLPLATPAPCDCRKSRAPRKPKSQMVVLSETLGPTVTRPFLADSPLDGVTRGKAAPVEPVTNGPSAGGLENGVTPIAPAPAEATPPAPLNASVSDAVASLEGSGERW